MGRRGGVERNKGEGRGVESREGEVRIGEKGSGDEAGKRGIGRGEKEERKRV